MPRQRQRSRSTRRTRSNFVKVSVGQFPPTDGVTDVVLSKTDTIKKAFEQGGYDVAEDEEVLTINGNKVDLDDKIEDGETYLASTKYSSGLL